jgi:uncharacterized protein
MKIPAAAKQLIENWRLGFVATVSEDGQPNVSPKGTFVVIDDETIAFAEMRSPNTMRNIACQPEVEVSFVDQLSRRGVRIRGRARAVPKGTAEFEALQPRFGALWSSELQALFNAVVIIPAETVRAFATPAYEAGSTEAELRASWKSRIAAM